MADLFKAPAYTPQYPGFQLPEEPSVGELYVLSKKNPCDTWAMKDFFSGSREKVHCMLPVDHEYNYGYPHIDFDKGKAWRNGYITDVWYKDKSPTPPTKDKEEAK